MSGGRPGRFITLEGGEGVGKTTQRAALARWLTAQGVDLVETREPGGSDGAEAIRTLLLGGAEERWSPQAEALLFAAARADHVEKLIRPALAAGRWVLSDRFLDSSLAYQGAGLGLGFDQIQALHRFGSGDFLPDRTLILSLDEARGAERARNRDGGGGDRIGGRDASFHRAVESGFRAIAAADPRRVRLINADGTPDAVTARLAAALDDML